MQIHNFIHLNFGFLYMNQSMFTIETKKKNVSSNTSTNKSNHGKFHKVSVFSFFLNFIQQ